MRLGEIAKLLGVDYRGEGRDTTLECLAATTVAGPRDLTFALTAADALVAARSRAAATVTTDSLAFGGLLDRALAVDDVLVACARAAAWLPVRRADDAVERPDAPAVDPSARVSDGAVLGAGVAVGECSVVEAGAVLGTGVRIGAFCRVEAGAIIRGGAQIGNRVHIGAGTDIGAGGFTFVRDGSGWLRVPCFGSVRIGDDVVILPRTVVHAGVVGDTVVARGCILDSQVLIGHDCQVGADTAIAGQTAVAGGAIIGRGCVIGGKVGIGEGVSVADGVTITGMSMVMRSIEECGGRYASGWPAAPAVTWWRKVASFRRGTGSGAAPRSGRQD